MDASMKKMIRSIHKEQKEFVDQLEVWAEAIRENEEKFVQYADKLHSDPTLNKNFKQLAVEKINLKPMAGDLTNSFVARVTKAMLLETEMPCCRSDKSTPNEHERIENLNRTVNETIGNIASFIDTLEKGDRRKTGVSKKRMGSGSKSRKMGYKYLLSDIHVPLLNVTMDATQKEIKKRSKLENTRHVLIDDTRSPSHIVISVEKKYTEKQKQKRKTIPELLRKASVSDEKENEKVCGLSGNYESMALPSSVSPPPDPEIVQVRRSCRNPCPRGGGISRSSFNLNSTY